ncbi:unnamed protein product [Closterium sp. Naga37s-1]|nr:unnamed protein product [Closterium sp. Naga37s-1]
MLYHREALRFAPCPALYSSFVSARLSALRTCLSLPPSRVRSAAGSRLTGFPISELYQVQHYLAAVQRQLVGASPSPVDRQDHATPDAHDSSDQAIFEDMLSFQRDPIPTALTRLPTDLQAKAVCMFQDILHYMGLNGAPITDERELVQALVRILEMVLGKPEMQEELYAQLHKQTRNNHDREACLRVWEVMHLCASVVPPGVYLGTPIIEYVQEIANDGGVDEKVKSKALATWNALKKAMKVGARKTVPTVDELLALKTGRALKTMVYFLDDRFEEAGYDASTTASEILKSAASSINLERFETFGLYEHRKYITFANNVEKVSSESQAHSRFGIGRDDYLDIDENAYMGDVMAKLMSFKEESKREVQLRLLFRKKFFRKSEEAITDEVFIRLSYLQAKQDYEEGNYPVLRDDCGLRLADRADWQAEVEKRIPKQFQPLRQKGEWGVDVLTRYKALSKLVPEDAKQEFLKIIRAQPYVGSAFYHVRRIEDPIRVLPEQLLIGINKRGFETTQGAEICLDIRTQINNAETRRSARAFEQFEQVETLVSAPAAAEAKLQRELQAGKAFEASQRSSPFPCVLARLFPPSPFTHQLKQEVAARAASEAKLQAELQEALRQGEVANEEAVEERARLAEKLRVRGTGKAEVCGDFWAA